MRNRRVTERREQRAFRSYDYILERHIGRPSKHTAARIRRAQKIGILLTGLVVTIFVLSLAVFFNREPVEASDGIEYRKDYVCIEIEEGDSLWSLAAEYRTEEIHSLEDFVAELEDVNGIEKNTVLKPGNKLMVPCYKTISR